MIYCLVFNIVTLKNLSFRKKYHNIALCSVFLDIFCELIIQAFCYSPIFSYIFCVVHVSLFLNETFVVSHSVRQYVDNTFPHSVSLSDKSD